MKAFLKALVLVPIALLIVLFSVANRAPVRVSLDPFSRDLPTLSYELQLFAVVLAWDYAVPRLKYRQVRRAIALRARREAARKSA